MSVMRKRSQSMVLSAHTCPSHFLRGELCEGRRASQSAQGGLRVVRCEADLTAFIAKIIVDALRLSRWSTLHRRRQHRLQEGHHPGVAVALDNGLIVPHLPRRREELLGLTRAINDLAARARSKKR